MTSKEIHDLRMTLGDRLHINSNPLQKIFWYIESIELNRKINKANKEEMSAHPSPLTEERKLLLESLGADSEKIQRLICFASYHFWQDKKEIQQATIEVLKRREYANRENNISL